MADDFMSGFLAGQGDNSSRGNSFLGGDGLAAIIIIALLFGWGRGGYGAGNGASDGGSTGAGAAMAGYVLTSDFANIERKIDGVNNGLCDGFYAQAQLVNGVQQSMASGFMSAELSRANQQAALMQQLNAMQRSADNCCCENRAAIAQVRYDMATQACDTRNTVQVAARDIIDSQNAGTRAVLDFLTNSRLRDLEAENSTLKLAASQAAQNNYLVNTLRPAPIPAYQVQNPYSYGANGCGGCGNY